MNKELIHGVPELLFDKQFHVFMCFANDDERVARELVQKLEGTGFKCCLHSRDFLGGCDILSNMNTNIEKSMYVVILLSDNYYESKYCSHETSVALHSKIKHKTNVLPVMIEPCQIPSMMSHITCINCEDGDYSDLHTRIYNAVVKQENLQDITKVPTGKMVTVVPEMIGSRYRITIKDEIRNGHREISDETFDMAELTINRSFALRTLETRNRYCGDWCIVFVIGCLFWIEVYLILVLGCFSGKPVPHVINCKASPFILILGGILVLVFVCVCCLPFCRCTKFTILRLEQKTYFCTRIENYKNCQIGASESKEECTRRTFSDYLSINAHMLHTEESNYHLRVREMIGRSEVRVLIDQMITERLHKHDVRHGTSNNVPCLCLQVEQWLQDGKEQLQYPYLTDG